MERISPQLDATVTHQLTPKGLLAVEPFCLPVLGCVQQHVTRRRMQLGMLIAAPGNARVFLRDSMVDECMECMA